MPHFVSSIRQIERPGQMLTHLATLVTVLQSVIVPYLDDIFQLLCAYWNSEALPDVLAILCEISNATSEGLKVR